MSNNQVMGLSLVVGLAVGIILTLVIGIAQTGNGPGYFKAKLDECEEKLTLRSEECVLKAVVQLKVMK